MKCWAQTAFVFMCLYPCLSLGATLSSINVEQQGDRYTLHIKAQINANIYWVKQIMTDYEKLPSINPYLKESKIISITKDNRTTVSMLNEACILFICYKIRDVQVFQLLGPDIIYGKVIPQKSDFKYGWTRWTIREDMNNAQQQITNIILDSEITPDFFIVPIIGPYQLKKKILEIATITINNLEIAAQK